MPVSSELNKELTGLRRLLAFAGRPRRLVTLIILVALVTAGLKLAQAWLTKLALDFLLAGNRAGFVRAVAVQLALICCAAALQAGWGVRLARYVAEISASMRKAFMASVIRQPLAQGTRWAPGSLGSRLTSDITSGSAFVDPLYSIMRDLIMALASAAYMIAMNWRLGVVTAVTSPIIAWAGARLSRSIPDLSARIQQSMAELAAFAQDMRLNCATVKIFGLEPYVSQRFRALDESVLRENLKLNGRMALIEGAVWLCAAAPLTVPLGFGGYMVFRGLLSPGTMVATLQLSNHLRGPLVQLGNRLGELRKRTGSVRDVLYEIDEAIIQPQVPAIQPTNRYGQNGHPAAIQIADLSFSYHDCDGPVLVDVSLSLPAGRTTFIVGVSGCGKTTLLKVMGGLYRVEHGKVVIAGPTPSSGQANPLRPILYVPQEPFLLPWTLRENLVVANPGATDEEIATALYSASAEFCWSLERGLDTPLAEGGKSLSTGQAQRICIARALLARPAILLLDEPGASLDAQTEAQLMLKLREAMAGRTMVVVTHRLESIRDDDYVVSMADGRVIRQGWWADFSSQARQFCVPLHTHLTEGGTGR